MPKIGDKRKRNKSNYYTTSTIPGGKKHISSTMADAKKVVKSIDYLIPNWIPLGMVTGIVAPPKAGKSAFVLDCIVKPIVTGCNWFDQSPGLGEPGYVVWCDTERRMAINLQRMEEWGIPTDRIILPFKNDPLRAVDLTDDDHLKRIEKLVRYYEAQAFVVDSLRGSHNEDENSSKVGRILQNIAGIAERTGAACPLVHHTRKLNEGGKITADSSRGSNAILAMMQAMIGIDRPDPNSKSCRIQMLGENLGIAPKPMGFTVTNTGIKWVDAPKPPPKADKEWEKAVVWLEQNMEPDKWYCAKSLIAKAKKAGHTTNALQRAREKVLGITTQHGNIRKRDKKSEWRRPRLSS